MYYWLLLAGLALSGGGIAYLATQSVAWVTISTIGVLLISYLISSIRIVSHTMRWVIECFGKFYREWGPGIHFLFRPFLSVAGVVTIREAPHVLYKKAPEVDLRDGTIIPVGVEAYIYIYKPDDAYLTTSDVGRQIDETGTYRAVYVVARDRLGRLDQKALIDPIESAITAYLNQSTFDEAIFSRADGRLGFELRLSEPARQALRDRMHELGFEISLVTFKDFALPENVKLMQTRIREAELLIEVATNEQRAKAIQGMGTYVNMLMIASGLSEAEIQAKVAADPEMFKTFLSIGHDLTTRRLSLDFKALRDIRSHVAGGGGAEGVLSAVMAGLESLRGNSPATGEVESKKREG